MRALAVIALASLLGSPLARADDCDLLDAAAGTGTTQIAQQLDRCLADPACVGAVPPNPGHASIDAPGKAPGAPPGDPPRDPPPTHAPGTAPPLPPPRERHGFVAGGDATIGTLSELHSDRDALSAGELVASGRAGWLAGPQACASTTVVAGTESRGDTAFHVVFPWPLFETGMIGFEQQWQLRPRLDSSRVYLRRLYSSTTVEAGIAPVAWARADGGAAAVLPFRIASMQRDQDRSGATLQSVRFSAYESTRAEDHLEVLPVTFTTMYPHGPVDAAQQPLPASSELVRVDALDLARRHGALGYELTVGALFASHPIAAPVAGRLGLTWGPWSGSVERAAYLAMDDSITIEDRIAASYHEGRWRAAGFAALTHTSGEPRAQLTGGGSAGVDLALPEELKLALDVEVARSYYARVDADPRPRPELAGTGTVSLTRHFTVNPTAH